MSAPSLRFDRFELHPRERQLLDEGRPVAVGGRAFDVLVTLAGRAGHLVTKAELMDQVWPGLVVEENNLAAQVSALRKVLGGEIIATIPGRGYRFNPVAQIIVEADPVPAAASVASPAATAVTTPAGSRLFGREADLVRIAADLERPGCVTLVGAAGVGKTRLAQAVAARWAGRFAWVDLAALANASQIYAALARSLETQLPENDPLPALARALRGERVLVVLDNAEHVVDAIATLVATMQQAADQVRVLVTSQLPLAVPGERVDRLEPLLLPAATLSDADALQEGAVALLVDRICAADHRFQASAATLPLLREICSRLDGLPLALEMAAARVPLLGLLGVRDALNQRFSLLTTGHRGAPGRHKTLHAALDWSHGLLGEDERRLFRTLGVFAGGFTLDLVAAVATDEDTDRWSVIDSLAVLVDRSLVATSHDDPPRYHLLETMRAYALEQLAAAGEEQAQRGRHARVLLELFACADRAAPKDEIAALQAKCRAEIDNAREAMAWALRSDPVTAITLAVHAAQIVTFTHFRLEVQAWLAACEPLVDERIEPRLRTTWTYEYARQLLMSNQPRALELACRARDLCRGLGDDLLLFKCHLPVIRDRRARGPVLDEACAEVQQLLQQHPEWSVRAHAMAAGALAVACETRGDHAGRLAQREIELKLAIEAGLPDQADAAETNIVNALTALDRLDEALARSNAVMQRIGMAESGNAAYGWVAHIDLLVKAGCFEQTRRQAPYALTLCRRFDISSLGGSIALFAAREGRVRAAARLIGHARQACLVRSQALDAEVEERLEAAAALVRERLDEATLRRLSEEGSLLDDASADRLAFSETDED